MIVRTLILAACFALASCASDGSFAHGKPVDKATSIKATCDGIAKADQAFQSFVKYRPGVIDANGIAAEAAVLETVKPVCTPPYAGDQDAAENTVISGFLQITILLANWRH